SCTLLGCGGGGGTNGPAYGKETYPEWEDNQYMWIGGWDPPINTLEDYKMAKDMGLTHMFIDGVFAKKGTEAYLDQLRFCEQVGLKAIVGNDILLDNAEGREVDLTDYSVYPAVDMINVWDEPYVNSFGECAGMVEQLNDLYKGKDMTLYINANPANNISATAWEPTTQSYLQKFYDQILSKVNGRKIFTTDIYPLLEIRGVYALDTRWLNTMAVYANMAKQYDGEFHMFIQNYRISITRETLSRKDFTFQIYTDMAFGINGFSYFTYRKSFIEEFGGGCVDNQTSCTPTASYEWAKEVNAEISAFDHVYLSFDWDGAMSVKGTYNLEDDEEYENSSFGFYKELTELKCASKVTATQDTVIGQFQDDEGRDALIITNFTLPTDDVDDRVTIDFKDCNRAMVWENGVQKVYEVKNNKLTLDIPSGEGVF
ncbi:MAG: hypothetical protein K2L54_00485, partial [Clostridiales bacterium]|nr:hypothetical protein [Clostridiales bacterium]